VKALLPRTLVMAPVPHPTRRTSSPGQREGFRSGLEELINQQLTSQGISPQYESFKIEYLKPARVSRYTPDWKLPNGIIIESKGRFVTADRQKHLLVKAQHPHFDIRFVFSNPNQRISKTSATTYAMWCVKNGFKFAKKLIPQEWINEKPNG
jgi:hypothetical protein